jgi:O-6-methylguanine DNA methyltransferase
MLEAYLKYMDTPLGQMLAVANNEYLISLEFLDQKRIHHNAKLASNHILELLDSELCDYFDGSLQKFTTKIHLSATDFQKLAWNELIKIPYGETRSYKTQAELIGKPRSYRAVARANGNNRLAIIVPCHRIINSNGDLGGYNGGIWRKKWLIEHESS